MALSTQPYKGSRDFYPDDQRIQNWMFRTLGQAVERFGFEPYNGPMLEPFELYAAKTGEEIVNNQLYWLMDRGERKLAIRPEMTPTLARMVAAQFHEIPKPIRWYSLPNLWRYERPQRGRLREHWQLNLDILGGNTLYADVEVLDVALQIFESLKANAFVAIKLNHRGLMDHFLTHVLKLKTDSAFKLIKLVDLKNKLEPTTFLQSLKELGLGAHDAATLEDFFKMDLDAVLKKYPCDAIEYLAQVMNLLKEMGYKNEIEFDASVVRGLDYYTGIVFEMYDVSPENKRAIFGGGRYDNLVGLFGKQNISGVGFGMGDVTLRQFLETHKLLPTFQTAVDVYVGLPQKSQWVLAQKIGRRLRALGLHVVHALEENGFGEDLKTADKLGAKYALLIGENELRAHQIIVKNLRAKTQDLVPIDQLESYSAWGEILNRQNKP